MSGQGHPAFVEWAEGLASLHREKSGGYGTGVDPFANFSAVAASKRASGERAERWEYAVDRAEEKITRIRSLTAQGRFSEIAEEFRDIGGLMGCCHAMLIDDHPPKPDAPAPPDSAFKPGCSFPTCDCMTTCKADDQ